MADLLKQLLPNIPLPNFGGGSTLDVKDPKALTDAAGPPKTGSNPEQMKRAWALGSYFLGGAMAVNASQFLGAPLYLINQDWYDAWIAFTKESFSLLTTTMTQTWAPTVVKVSGDKSVRGQIRKTSDGDLQCDFPDRLILIANHQIYTDWLYLWWIAYTSGKHGAIYIILKESLKQLPIIGWGMQFLQFIFLKRNWEQDKPNMARHLQKLNDALKPMWLLIFPEGTNLAPNTRASSAKWAKKSGQKDLKHQLLPRSTGLQFCLQQLQGTTEWVYDCTIAYQGVAHGQFAQDIFTIKAAYLEGRPPKSVSMYWRRFHISEIPFNNDEAFELWLRNRWLEKDMFLEFYQREGHFPADTGNDRGPDGKPRKGVGIIETEIKGRKWYEFMQIFAPVGLFALVLYMFYGELPRQYLAQVNQQSIQEQKKNVMDFGATLKNFYNMIPVKNLDEEADEGASAYSGSTRGTPHRTKQGVSRAPRDRPVDFENPARARLASFQTEHAMGPEKRMVMADDLRNSSVEVTGLNPARHRLKAFQKIQGMGLEPKPEPPRRPRNPHPPPLDGTKSKKPTVSQLKKIEEAKEKALEKEKEKEKAQKEKEKGKALPRRSEAETNTAQAARPNGIVNGKAPAKSVGELRAAITKKATAIHSTEKAQQQADETAEPAVKSASVKKPLDTIASKKPGAENIAPRNPAARPPLTSNKSSMAGEGVASKKPVPRPPLTSNKSGVKKLESTTKKPAVPSVTDSESVRSAPRKLEIRSKSNGA